MEGSRTGRGRTGWGLVDPHPECTWPAELSTFLPSVRLSGETKIRRRLDEAREDDGGLGPGQPGTEAEVHAGPETEVIAGVASFQFEAIRTREDVGVSIGRSDQLEDHLIGW